MWNTRHSNRASAAVYCSPLFKAASAGIRDEYSNLYDAELSPDIKFTIEENRASIITNNPPEHAKGYGVERGLGVKREQLDLPVVKDSHAAIDPEK